MSSYQIVVKIGLVHSPQAPFSQLAQSCACHNVSMFRSRLVVALCAAAYFAMLASLAFVEAPGSNGRFWIWTTVAFVPVGAFLVGMFGRHRWWAALAFSIVAAAWLEAAQTVWMPAGYADVIDIVLASVGAAVGVSLVVAVGTMRAHSRRPSQHRVSAAQSSTKLATTRRASASNTAAPLNLDR